MTLDRKTQIKILQYWLDNLHNIGKSPEELNIDKKDLANLLSLVSGKNFQSNIYEYYRKLVDEEYKERDAEFRKRALDIEDKSVKIQESTKRSQYIIAGVMIIAALISLGSVYYASEAARYSQLTYDLNLRLTDPKIKLNMDCSYSSNGDLINITVYVTNTGKSGAYVSGDLIGEGISLGNMYIEGIEQDQKIGNKIESGPFFLKGEANEVIIKSRINISETTVEKFTLKFVMECKYFERPCTITPPSETSCNYYKDDGEYKLSQTCYAIE